MTKAKSYHSGFHYSPWWEGTLSHIWHNRSDRLSAAFPLREKKKQKHSTVRVEAGRPDISGLQSLHAIKPGCGMFSLPSFS